MAVAPIRAVIWEWQRDDGGYSPYYPEVIYALERARKNGKPELNLGTASTLLNPYKVDLVNSQQIRTGTGMVRDVRRSEIYVSGTPCYGLWEWLDGSNVYNIYNITAMFEIEEAYTLKHRIVDLSVKPSRLPYTIDFTSMYQTRHYFNTRRKIRRIQLSSSLQSYLAVSKASTLGSKHYNLLESSAHGAFSMNHSTTMPSASSWVKDHVSSSMPGTKSMSHSEMAAISMHTSSPTKGPSTSKTSSTSKKSSTSVASKSIGKLKHKSAPTDVIDPTSGSSVSATSKSPKRIRRKVKPVAKDLAFSPGMTYLRKVSHVEKKDDGPCPICMIELSEADEPGEDGGVYKLTKCGHMMHTPCVKAYIDNSSFSQGNFQCPICKKIYGIKTGDMPPGSMTVLRQMNSLPGHEGYGTIQITYSFHAGIHNGKRYSANGFPRVCYLPDSPRGQKVLKLLRKAWDRKLTFTIGTSVTSGASDTIVWNEIHHKTESSTNFSGHGYPDPKYLDNVTAELAAQGVEDSEDEASDIATSYNGSSSDSDL